MTLEPFASRLLRWFDQHGRHDLPWQHPRSAYRVWLSEVMLQQTQVTAVIPYFERFLAHFPTLQSLAEAPVDAVLAQWAGLGYYARARNLHAAARTIMAEHGGAFPEALDAVQALPGIGRSTAAAILSQVHGQRHAILDGNVKRVLARWAAVEGWPGAPNVQTRLWALAESLLPTERMADYSQALMDLGATLCTARRPACDRCPLADDCAARIAGRIGELPQPKPRRVRPQREAWLLIAEDEAGRWLLETRPPTGIWGGLWCPPVVASDEDWTAQLAARHGLALEVLREAPAIDHAFSHYDLRLRPLHGRARALGSVLADGGGVQWIAPAQLLARRAPLPAPLSRYLEAQAGTANLPVARHSGSVRRPKPRRNTT